MTSAAFAPAFRVALCTRNKPVARTIACNASGAEHGHQRRRALLLGVPLSQTQPRHSQSTHASNLKRLPHVVSECRVKSVENLGASIPRTVPTEFRISGDPVLFRVSSHYLSPVNQRASVPVALAAAPASHALEKFDLPIDQLSAFDRAEQRQELVQAAGMALRKQLDADDAVIALRLAVNDAGTYDVVTKTGGFDASIILNKAEASRPENAGFEDYIAKLGKAKAELDAFNANLGAEPMSWTDMMFLGVKVTREAEWRRIKVNRAAIPSGGDTIVKTFGSEWTLKLGRLDSTEEPVKRCLAPGASTAEMEKFYLELGAKPNDTGPFAAKPPFWPKYSFLMYPAAQDDPKAYEEMLAADSKEFAKWKLGYDRSRATVTRTDYEVDFINTFTRMTSLGSKFNPNAYLHTRPSYKYG